MTQTEAERRTAELNHEETDPSHHWFAQRQPTGDWRAVRVLVPGARDRGPLKAHIESKPRPDEPPDPRPSIFQNIPPYGAG